MGKTYKKIKKGGLKTRKNICSPSSNIHKLTSNTCMTPDIVLKIKKTYNDEHPLSKINTNDPIKIFKNLRQRFKCDMDTCWLEKIGDKAVKSEIKKRIFIPKRPVQWTKTPNEWLSNYDILNVIKQYEEAYPEFYFIGPTPIDFEKKLNGSCVTRELCSFHLGSVSSKKQIGIIFNLDEHDEPGSHWVSMYIDIDNKKIYYFDSASTEIPKEIESFKNRLIQENGDFYFLSNSVEHQKGNTECGMYSLYFIIQMLLSKNRLKLFNNRFNNDSYKITDKNIEEYRSIYFY